jgi:hypothetical protein
MKRLACCVVLLCLSLPVAAQHHRHGFPPPPEAAAKSDAAAKPDTRELRPHLDPLQLQREARELSDLARSLPVDIDHVNQGLLPKDIIEKLKRIEKLSKRLRGELAF